MKATVLVVDDDRAFRTSCAALLRDEGYRVHTAADGSEAVAVLEDSGPVDLIVLDLKMPGIDGIDLTEVLRTRGEGAPILMVSGYGSVETAVSALHAGVDDFVSKPVEPDVMSARVSTLLARRPRPGSAQQGEDGPGARALGRMLGRSPGMDEVRDAIRRVGPTDAAVLILGETGTGKELAARAVHEVSRRRDGPFVAVNGAALSESLIESELFGHVRGAFTGASHDRDGFFQAAHGGTLFLDEVGDLPAGAQRRLLRVIQEGEIVRLGDTRPRRVDVRLVAATNRDLGRLMEDGSFRADLYYRLNVFRIEVPALRRRRIDIPVLIEGFLGERSTARPNCSPLAMRLLQVYPWPGNVRELFAALESALIRADGRCIEAQHLPAEIRGLPQTGSSPAEGEEGSGTAPNRVRGWRYCGPESPRRERAAIEAALEEAAGVRVRAAEILGMGRTTLWRKMKEYGIEV